MPRAATMVSTVLLWLVACGPDTDQLATTTADSLGTKVATTPAAAFDSITGALTFGSLEDTPILRVGGRLQASDAELFHGIKGAQFVGDSVLAVLDGASRQVRFFDQSGRFLSASAGPGQGPGELVDASSLLALPQNRVLVWDGARGLATTFGTDGRPQNIIRANGEALAQQFPALLQYPPVYRWTLVAPDRLLLFVPGVGQRPPQEGSFRMPVSYVLVPLDFTRADTLGAYPGIEQHRLHNLGVVPVLNARETYFTALAGNGIYIGDSEAFRVDRFTPTGATDLSIRLSGDPRALTSEEIETGRTALAGWLETVKHPRADSILKVAQPAAVAPAFRDLIADDAERLWMRLSRRAGGGDRYAVFDTAGIFQGSVQLPPHERVLAIAGGKLALLQYSEDDVESVSVYRYTAPRAAGR